MSVELVNGYVLLPNPPDWGDRLRLRREWRTTIAEGVTGAEDRASFRHLPLRGIEYGILPLSLQEERKLIDRILAAKRSGLAAVPFWGRGVPLAVTATGSTVVLADEEAWEWSPDDHVFFSDQDRDTCEVGQVQGVSGATLTLKAPLAGTYRGFCWPLLFGLFRCESLRILTSHHGSLRIAVLERDARPELTVDLCAIILVRDGGGDSFECYADDIPVHGLAAGTWFAGPWVDATLFIGIQDEDTFEGYGNDADLNGLHKGLVWGGPWVDRTLWAGLIALDSFESYSDGVPVSGLNGGQGFGGEGWGGAWNEPSLSVPGDGGEPMTPGDYRYYRLLIAANNGDTSWSGVLELELREAVGGANVATGGTASASAFASSPDLAFDGLFTSGNGWNVQNSNSWPIWLQYDFGEGVTRRVVEYRVGSYNTTNSTSARSSRIWELQGSNNGSTWTTVHRVGNQTGWTFGEMRTFPS